MDEVYAAKSTVKIVKNEDLAKLMISDVNIETKIELIKDRAEKTFITWLKSLEFLSVFTKHKIGKMPIKGYLKKKINFRRYYFNKKDLTSDAVYRRFIPSQMFL